MSTFALGLSEFVRIFLKFGHVNKRFFTFACNYFTIPATNRLKFVIKREQKQACLNYAERERTRCETSKDLVEQWRQKN